MPCSYLSLPAGQPAIAERREPCGTGVSSSEASGSTANAIRTGCNQQIRVSAPAPREELPLFWTPDCTSIDRHFPGKRGVGVDAKLSYGAIPPCLSYWASVRMARSTYDREPRSWGHRKQNTMLRGAALGTRGQLSCPFGRVMGYTPCSMLYPQGLLSHWPKFVT